ncbi:MAG: hypothetical protein IH892_00935 [Planctomycetes bacterium]|nr:hypothetical protein [Planctomycetota bacterium]
MQEFAHFTVTQNADAFFIADDCCGLLAVGAQHRQPAQARGFVAVGLNKYPVGGVIPSNPPGLGFGMVILILRAAAKGLSTLNGLYQGPKFQRLLEEWTQKRKKIEAQ